MISSSSKTEVESLSLARAWVGNQSLLRIMDHS